MSEEKYLAFIFLQLLQCCRMNKSFKYGHHLYRLYFKLPAKAVNKL